MGDNLAAQGADPAPVGNRNSSPAVSHVAVATISISPSLQSLVNEALATWMPRAAVLPMSRDDVIGNRAVRLVIVGPTTDGEAALAELRLLRAQGYCNPVLLLSSEQAESDDENDVELIRLGARRCAISDGFVERLATLAATGRRDSSADTEAFVTGLQAEVEETRNLLALAEVARRLPHAMNNPLSALLAEAQLMELEELEPEQREATERIVNLARRVIGLVRELQQAQPRR